MRNFKPRSLTLRCSWRGPWGGFARAVCAAAVLALPAAGCSSIKKTVGGTWLGEEMFEDEYIPSCPKVRLLTHHDTLTLFTAGPGRDLTDVRFEVDLNGYKLACGHDIDDETLAGELAVELNAVLIVDRGPADKSRKIAVPYVVTLRDADDGTLLQKNRFFAAIEFEGNQRRKRMLDETVEMTIPLFPGRTGRDFVIYIGLQLKPEHVEFNRSKKGKN
ncbi:MAG: hypothetical protein ACYYKD_13330 [Rhodospirillales bacterium]